MDAIEYSDFQELMSRGDNISNKFKATVKLNIDNVNHKRKEKNGKDYFFFYYYFIFFHTYLQCCLIIT